MIPLILNAPHFAGGVHFQFMGFILSVSDAPRGSGLSRFVLIIPWGHTAASMMIANGVDLVNAAAELGHATASTTLNIYAHQVARARAESSGVRAGAFAVLRQA